MDAFQLQFEARLKTGAYWHCKSQDLLVSARTLWSEMQRNSSLEVNCWATYMMLMGMSFELLFKSHCVSAEASFQATHNLAALAKAAQCTTSGHEAELLMILSEYVIWDGRYPVPKKAEYLANHWKRQSVALFNEQEMGNLPAAVRNDVFAFENLLPIWRSFSDLYMERYKQ